VKKGARAEAAGHSRQPLRKASETSGAAPARREAQEEPNPNSCRDLTGEPANPKAPQRDLELMDHRSLAC
jgi:hypothetical protein